MFLSRSSQNAEALEESFRTDADFHEGNQVTCISYALALPGLGSGSSNGGWLVTSSDNMLNLWECGKVRGSTALQVNLIK